MWGREHAAFPSSPLPFAHFQGHWPSARPGDFRNLHKSGPFILFLACLQLFCMKGESLPDFSRCSGAGKPCQGHACPLDCPVLAAPLEAAVGSVRSWLLGPGPERGGSPHPTCRGSRARWGSVCFLPVMGARVRRPWMGVGERLWGCHVTLKPQAGNVSCFFPAGMAGSVRLGERPLEPGKRQRPSNSSCSHFTSGCSGAGLGLHVSVCFS